MGVLPYLIREDCFALKGGTAINLFLLNISKALVRIADSIETEQRNLSVQKMGSENEVLKLLVQRDRLQIKVEVSPVLRGGARATSLRGVSPEVERRFGYTEARHLHPHDLYAGKICAALDR